MHRGYDLPYNPKDGLVAGTFCLLAPTLKERIVFGIFTVIGYYLFGIGESLGILTKRLGFFLGHNTTGTVGDHDLKDKVHAFCSTACGGPNKLAPLGIFNGRSFWKIFSRQSELQQDFIRLPIFIEYAKEDSLGRPLFGDQRALGIPQRCRTVVQHGKLVNTNAKIVGGSRVLPKSLDRYLDKVKKKMQQS
jgi:hypothetical protein